jgi:hypothetical protein
MIEELTLCIFNGNLKNNRFVSVLNIAICYVLTYFSRKTHAIEPKEPTT